MSVLLQLQASAAVFLYHLQLYWLVRCVREKHSADMHSRLSVRACVACNFVYVWADVRLLAGHYAALLGVGCALWVLVLA